MLHKASQGSSLEHILRISLHLDTSTIFYPAFSVLLLQLHSFFVCSSFRNFPGSFLSSFPPKPFSLVAFPPTRQHCITNIPALKNREATSCLSAGKDMPLRQLNIFYELCLISPQSTLNSALYTNPACFIMIMFCTFTFF